MFNVVKCIGQPKLGCDWDARIDFTGRSNRVGVSDYAGANSVVGMVEDSVMAGLNRSILTDST